MLHQPRPHSTSPLLSAALTTASWRKSSRSQGSGAECVEVTGVLDVIAVRDSKAPEKPCLLITTRIAQELITTIKSGLRDL